MHDLSQWTPRPAPKPVSLTGAYAMIEPYRRDIHLNALWDAFGRDAVNELIRYFPNGPYEGPDGLGEWLDHINATGTITNVIRSRRSGDVVGMASYMRPDPANGVIEVGSVAHGAAMARSQMSTDAHYLLAKHVFEDLGYRRYEWKCHNLNEPSKVTARRLGFSYEGLFRQHIVAKGVNRDTAWFSMIDSEWPSLAHAFETWLDASNFDAEGRQKRKLEDIRADLA